MECGKQWAPRSVCALNNGYWMAYHLFLKEWLRESSSYYVILFCKYWLLKNVMLIKTSQNNSIRKTKGPNHFQSCLFFQGLFAQKVSLSQLRSLYLSRAVSNFYGTEIEIWAGFGPVGSTDKKLGRLWAIFEGGFTCFLERIFFFFNFQKNIVGFAVQKKIP